MYSLSSALLGHFAVWNELGQSFEFKSGAEFIIYFYPTFSSEVNYTKDASSLFE